MSDGTKEDIPDDHGEKQALINEIRHEVRLHRPGMEPAGQSPTERAPGFGLFRESEVSALLFGTWLAIGASPGTVKRLCLRAGIDAPRAEEIAKAFEAAGGSDVLVLNKIIG